MTAPDLDVALAYWLAEREATAHRRAKRQVPLRLRAHIRALADALASEDGRPVTPSRGSSEPLESPLSLPAALTAEQAAAELRISPRQARRLGRRIGGRRIGGRWLFDPAAVAEHHDGRTPEDA